ncbi:MAG: peptidyl-tRNA hydrolase [Clostridia bacterium]|nr:peptidyl-tRNA hydrolase [Clostridia bacterium]
MRQLIIARKDLAMSPGKLAAQVSHASMAYFAHLLRTGGADEVISLDDDVMPEVEVLAVMPEDVYLGWLFGSFTKTVCEARNRAHLLKVCAMAEELGLRENEDYFLIRDNCLTELTPEEVDEDGQGRTLTCIGFRPLPDEVSHQLSRKYHLYV